MNRTGKGVVLCGVIGLQLLLCGCGDLFKPGKRAVERQTNLIGLLLSRQVPDQAAQLHAKTFAWIPYGQAKVSSDAFKAFHTSLTEAQYKKFVIHVSRVRRISDTRYAVFAQCQLQSQGGMVDVENIMWDCKLIWLNVDGEWLLELHEELTGRKKHVWR